MLKYLIFLTIGLFSSAGYSEEQLINQANIETTDTIEVYFSNFEDLCKSEKWEEIIVLGSIALEEAKKANRRQDRAKICAQLTSTAFYLGNYFQALIYAKLCYRLSKEFDDPTLFLRALYLKSAVHRALAAKCQSEQFQEALYSRAVKIGEKAVSIYSRKSVNNINLQGKIYFNLGAAHADNPKGDLKKAADCYSIAIECFRNTNATDDVIRTSLRLGKIHLLQKNYDLSQQTVDEVRPFIANERLSMHADYLEAQLKFATKNIESAREIARHGLERAKILGAKEDELRLTTLLQKIEEFQ